MTQLGYACISVPLRAEGVYPTRTLTLDKIGKLGMDAIKSTALANIADLGRIIERNESHGIRFFRVTSSLFPHVEDPGVDARLALRGDGNGAGNGSTNYTIDFARDELARVGAMARGWGHRLTMHPGQFAQLGSPRPDVVAQTGRDLAHHADILSSMGYSPALGSVLIIHGGGSYGDKSATLGRWVTAFRALPERVRNFISLENDDYQYTVLDLLPICERERIPLCVDFFHHMCLGADLFDIFDRELLRRVIRTWTTRGIKPKCHWSDQAEGKRKGAHADFIALIPDEILDFAHEFGVDIMCECKQKDLCVQRLLDRHFTRDVGGAKEHPRVGWSLR